MVRDIFLYKVCEYGGYASIVRNEPPVIASETTECKYLALGSGDGEGFNSFHL